MELTGLDGRTVPNGCDWFPDRLFAWDWKHCCDAHDIAYTLGGTELDRLAAETAFFGCLSSTSPVLAFVMAGTTFAIGWLFFNFRQQSTPANPDLKP